MTEILRQEATEVETFQADVIAQDGVVGQQDRGFIDGALQFIKGNLRRLERGSAAGLATLAIGGYATESAFASPEQASAYTAQAAPTPTSLMHGVNVFYETTVAPWRYVSSAGAMNNIQHMDVDGHSYELSAVCNITSKYNSNFNSVSFVRNNLQGDYEVTCQNGDQAAEHGPLTPINKECYNSTFHNCKDMNLVPVLEREGTIVGTYLKQRFNSKLVNVNFGRTTRLHVDNYKGQNKSDAEVYYAKAPGVKGPQAKEVIIDRIKNQQTYKVDLYPQGTITVK
ncbi:MAG TPA: hypothetical protein VFN31_00195 [Candidatus Saccharimonadales bacterium]|nr:hypothetical protein [Candidatus Saccharimonadales bacterium]